MLAQYELKVNIRSVHYLTTILSNLLFNPFKTLLLFLSTNKMSWELIKSIIECKDKISWIKIVESCRFHSIINKFLWMVHITQSNNLYSPFLKFKCYSLLLLGSCINNFFWELIRSLDSLILNQWIPNTSCIINISNDH